MIHGLKNFAFLTCFLMSLGWMYPASLVAQEPPLSLSILQIRPAPDGTVQVLASVVDRKGHPVRELSPANFSVKVEGEEVKEFRLERVAEAGKPLSVILAMDVSGSMKGAAIEGAKKAASAFLDQLAKEDSSALMTFGTGVKSLVDFTHDRWRVRTALEGLKATDAKTHLHQALFDALERASTAPTSRAVIVVLTDGKDEGSAVVVQDVITKAGAADVSIYTLGFGPKADVDFLRRLATLTRGAFFSTPNPEELPQLYTRIADQLKNQYLLSLSLPRWTSGRYTLALTLGHRGETLTATQSFSYLPVEGGSAPPTWWLARVAGRLPWVSAYPWMALSVVIVLVGAGGVLAFVLFRRRGALEPETALTVVPPRVWLEVVKGADTGQRFLLTEEEAVIGRSRSKAQFLLEKDSMVSREHARIRLNPAGQYVVEDLRSSGGTKVNGVMIEGPVILQPDDRIEVGQSELLFIDNR